MVDPDSQLPDVFQFDDAPTSFEALGKDNGFRSWSARELQIHLGYATWDSFSKVVNRAIAGCSTTGIPVLENFVQETAVMGGVSVPDYRLSKFACYLVSMNGDPKIANVARAQAFFATLAEAFQKYIQSAEDVERLDIRAQVTDHQKSLGSVASSHGVTNFAFFQDAGYRGMYNMPLKRLVAHKGLSKRGRLLLDFMGKRELAANLFRLTETEAKIKNQNVHGQKPLENAAQDVGRDVRDMMKKQGGPLPEDLPLAEDIKKIGTDLKKTHQQLKKPAKEAGGN